MSLLSSRFARAVQAVALLSFLFLLAAPAVTPLHAAQTAADTADDSATAETADTVAPSGGKPAVAAGKSQTVRRALGVLLENVRRNQAALDDLQAALNEAQDDEEKAAIQERIDTIQRNLSEQRAELEEIASGIASQSLTKPASKKFDWKAELGELLAPLMQQVKDLTARPREIEALRSGIKRRTEAVNKAKNALKRIDELIAEAQEPRVQTYLKAEQQRWQQRISDYQDALELAEVQLEQTLSESEPITQSASKLFKDFFSSRGLNLILAILAFLFVFFAMRFLHQKVGGLLFKKHAGETSVAARLANITINAMGTLLALAAALAVFYAAGDWVLLGIALLLILGIVWSAKTGISKYWEHVKLMLNVGGVREGERLVVDGVPYRVEIIRFYSTLANPELTGGRIRVAIDELMNRCSRPFEAGEPFFPTRVGDYVLVGGDFGKVIRQTPEQVQLELLSGSIKYLKTASFLAAEPMSVATGYTVVATFGVHYKHKDIATSEIPETLREAVAGAFAATDVAPHVTDVSTSFKEVGERSLDIAIFVTLSHEAAAWFYAAGRLAQKASLDACLEKGWDIPLPQLVVHKPAQQ